VRVAELVPDEAERGGLGVGALKQRGSDRGLEHEEMRGLRFVPARDEPVDAVEAAVGRDYEACPARPRADRAVARRRRLSARTTVVPTAMTRPLHAWTALTRRAVSAGTW